MSTENGKTPVIEKLQKLLRLAGSDNLHEAALEMEKAQALAMEHGIELARVNAAAGSLGEVACGEFAFGSGVARKWVCKLVQTHFGVVVMVGKRETWLYGAAGDIEFASLLIPFLIQQYRALWREVRENPWMMSENDYLHGLTCGIDSRLRAAQTVSVAGAEWGLVLRGKKAQIEAAILKENPNVKMAREKLSRPGEKREFFAGYRDAPKVGLNRPIEAAGRQGELGVAS